MCSDILIASEGSQEIKLSEKNSIIHMNQMAPLASQKVKTLANSSCCIYCLEIKVAMYSKTLHLHVTAL